MGLMKGNKTGNGYANVTCDYDVCPIEDYVNEIEDYVKPELFEWFVIVLFAVVFIVGIVGNFLVCFAVWRNSTMRNFTNYFIVNLAVADFLVVVLVLPPTLVHDVMESWFIGREMCKVLQFLQVVSVSVSVLTLSAISVERWYAICLPLKFKTTANRTRNMIIIIWIISIIIAIPEAVFMDTHRTVPANVSDLLIICRPTDPDKQQHYQLFVMIGLYFIPGGLLAVAYIHIVIVLWRNQIPGAVECSSQPMDQKIQSRRRAAKMLIAVVVCFFVCYFPVHLLNILRYTQQLHSLSPTLTRVLALGSHFLCYFNSALNPVIYNFMSGKFRKEFRDACSCCLSRGRPPKSPCESYRYSYSNANNTRTEQFSLTTMSPKHHSERSA
ncbi:orexin receptor type 2-like [Liolophura sinensis]|uniref:orexin receptor type 2-like n=1 Tax=Liolophura sinensis TaxID=3198878 RepID=UPI003158A067